MYKKRIVGAIVALIIAVTSGVLLFTAFNNSKDLEHQVVNEMESTDSLEVVEVTSKEDEASTEVIEFANTATVVSVEGKAFLERSEKVIGVTQDLKVEEGDIIVTDVLANVVISLDESKKVVLGGDTELLFLSLDDTPEAENYILTLKQGTVISDVSKKLEGDSNYNIYTPKFASSIRGTVASLSYDDEKDEAEVNFFEGYGLVSDLDTNEVTTITVGQKVVANENGGFEYQIIDDSNLNINDLSYLAENQEVATALNEEVAEKGESLLTAQELDLNGYEMSEITNEMKELQERFNSNVSKASESVKEFEFERKVKIAETLGLESDEPITMENIDSVLESANISYDDAIESLIEKSLNEDFDTNNAIVEYVQEAQVIEQPVIEQPVIEQPVIEQPVVEQPVVDASVTGKEESDKDDEDEDSEDDKDESDKDDEDEDSEDDKEESDKDDEDEDSEDDKEESDKDDEDEDSEDDKEESDKDDEDEDSEDDKEESDKDDDDEDKDFIDEILDAIEDMDDADDINYWDIWDIIQDMDDADDINIWDIIDEIQDNLELDDDDLFEVQDDYQSITTGPALIKSAE